MNLILKIIKSKDPILYESLKEKELLDTPFTFKWYTLLFSGDLPLENIVKLWDRLLSDTYRFEILEYCCASCIILMRNAIINGSTEKALEAIQNISILNVELLFDIADMLRRNDEGVFKILESSVK